MVPEFTLLLAEFSLQIKYFGLIQLTAMANVGPLEFWVTGHFSFKNLPGDP